MKLSTKKLALPPPFNPSTRSVGPTQTSAPPAPATPARATPAPATDLGSAVDASAAAHYGPNPLWVITGALALFFAVAAAFLAAG
jgi:hypothetical protein